MNFVTKRQTAPYFSNAIPGFIFWPFVLLLPGLYLLVLSLWAWPPFLAQYVFFLLPCTYVLWRFSIKDAFDMSRFTLRFVLVVFFSVVFTLLNNNFLDPFFQKIWPMPLEVRQVVDQLFHPHWRFGFAYDVFQIAFVPAIAEELLFRGLILTLMLRKLPLWAAVLLNGFLFALYHLNPWQFVGLFVLGCVFAGIFAKTRNLGFAMLAHFINNLIGVLTWWFFEKH